jgi:Flp pilus assembly protein TadG
VNAWLERLRKVRLASREDGSISVELVILFPVIALIVLGIMEFGHLWQVYHTLTIASREGARVAVVYQPGTDAVREAGAITAAKNTVTNYFLQTNPSWKAGTDYTVPDPVVQLNPATGLLVGGTLTVTVQSDNGLLVLHKLYKNITITAKTAMRFE